MSALIFMNSLRTKAKSRTKPAGKRDRNKAKTKEQILAAALELFRKKGLDGTTTKQISRKAGIAEGNLFNYFKTKEDLALFFFQKETHDLVEWFGREARLQRAPLPEKLARERRVSVLGAGALGTPVIEVLVRLGFATRFWSRTPHDIRGAAGFAGRERLGDLEAVLQEYLGRHRFRRDWVFVNIPPAWVQHLRRDPSAIP